MILRGPAMTIGHETAACFVGDLQIKHPAPVEARFVPFAFARFAGGTSSSVSSSSTTTIAASLVPGVSRCTLATFEPGVGPAGVAPALLLLRGLFGGVRGRSVSCSRNRRSSASCKRIRPSMLWISSFCVVRNIGSGRRATYHLGSVAIAYDGSTLKQYRPRRHLLAQA